MGPRESVPGFRTLGSCISLSFEDVYIGVSVRGRSAAPQLCWVTWCPVGEEHVRRNHDDGEVRAEANEHGTPEAARAQRRRPGRPLSRTGGGEVVGLDHVGRRNAAEPNDELCGPCQWLQRDEPHSREPNP